jgi:hypothetical protein
MVDNYFTLVMMNCGSSMVLHILAMFEVDANP